MTDEARLEAVLSAINAAMVGTGDAMVVDLGALEDGLANAGINCTATTNRGALTTELSFLRDELRTQRVRLDNCAADGALAELSALVARMEDREAEITGLLWPK